jgi:hypothetical protein
VSGNAQVLGSVGRLVDATINNALERGGVIDITTIGARSGLHHRVEIVFHHFDGNFYITGKPGSKRDLLANMNANPDFTVHLKRGPTVDIPATAREIIDQEQRAKVLYRILTESWDNEPSKAEHILPRWVEDAPLVEFTLSSDRS